jgi:hypothetical protein
MTKQWSESVRKSGKLLIWASSAATAGWSVALERAIRGCKPQHHAPLNGQCLETYWPKYRTN